MTRFEGALVVVPELNVSSGLEGTAGFPETDKKPVTGVTRTSMRWPVIDAGSPRAAEINRLIDSYRVFLNENRVSGAVDIEHVDASELTSGNSVAVNVALYDSDLDLTVTLYYKEGK